MSRLEEIRARMTQEKKSSDRGLLDDRQRPLIANDLPWLLERLDELAKFCREHMELHGGYWHRTISEALAKLEE